MHAEIRDNPLAAWVSHREQPSLLAFLNIDRLGQPLGTSEDLYQDIRNANSWDITVRIMRAIWDIQFLLGRDWTFLEPFFGTSVRSRYHRVRKARQNYCWIVAEKNCLPWFPRFPCCYTGPSRKLLHRSRWKKDRRVKATPNALASRCVECQQEIHSICTTSWTSVFFDICGAGENKRLTSQRCGCRCGCMFWCSIGKCKLQRKRHPRQGTHSEAPTERHPQ